MGVICVSRWLRDGVQHFRGFPELTCFSRLVRLVFHRLTIMQGHMTTPKVCLCGWLYANLKWDKMAYNPLCNLDFLPLRAYATTIRQNA
jgi:hypothetical protein